MKLKKAVENIFAAVFIAAVFFFFARTIYKNWQSIKNYHFSFNPAMLVFSLVLFYIGILVWGLLWNLILSQLSNKKLATKHALYIHLVSWMARYIPGKLGMVLTKMHLVSKKRISQRDVFFSVFYENFFQIVTGFLVGTPILFYYFFQTIENRFIYQTMPVLLMLASLFILYRPFFRFIINKSLELFKKETLPDGYLLSNSRVAENLVLYLLGTLLYGISFYFMLASLVPVKLQLLIPLSGIFIFSSVVSILALFTPTGLGVREGLMAILLQNYFPLEIATVIALFARVWVTVADGMVLTSVPIFRRIVKNEEKKIKMKA